MKTCIFAPCYLDDENNDASEFQTYRLTRNQKWLEYTFSLQDKLNFDAIYLLDNASDMNRLIALGGNIYDDQFNLKNKANKYPNLHIIRFDKHYKRTSWCSYHYWWRAMFFAWKNIRTQFGYNKIIHIDTDMFVLSQKLIDYLNNVNTGFTAFYCAIHKFPESTFHILCEDSFHVTDAFITDDYSKFDNQDAEHILPFTFINKDFNGDRYGEKALEQQPEFDYYGQCPNEILINYNARK